MLYVGLIGSIDPIFQFLFYNDNNIFKYKQNNLTNMSKTNILIPDGIHNSLRHLSIDSGKDMQDIIIEAIDEKIKKERLKVYKKK